MALTNSQALFVEHFLAGETAERAAELAGYSGANLRKLGQQLLKKPLVAEAIDRARSAVVKAEIDDGIEPLMTADYLMLCYQDQIRFSLKNVAKVVDGVMEFKPLNDWSDADARCVKKVKSTIATRPDGTTIQQLEFEFESKQVAMDKLGQYYGIWSGFDQLVRGLKEYGIEISRDGDKFQIKAGE